MKKELLRNFSYKSRDALDLSNSIGRQLMFRDGLLPPHSTSESNFMSKNSGNFQ
jgi:hypothetical protein